MGLSPLNLQLSVPRAPELSGLQQQAIQRPVMEQTMLEASVVKEAEHKRSQATAVDETEKGMIRDQEKEQGGQDSQKKHARIGTQQEKDEEKSSNHPYKGHHLDIRL
ncbi:hypothetical protein [Paenibacillus sp. FSL W7-1287]|uniref:hypothetical protein n=1 Tax=Paenibacillus sp. FSL W7-1287 TaxID=2954538 RepID=UPI0030FB9FB6